MAEVKAFIRTNKAWLLPMLDTSRNLMMLLPGRFNEGEVRGEAAYTALTLVCLYTEQVCGDRLVQSDEGDKTDTRSGGRSSLWRCRYDLPPDDSAKHARLRKRLLQLLTMLYHSEVLIELICEKRFGGSSGGMPALLGKFRVIAIVESIKALVRLWLLKANHGRMLAEMNEEQEKEQAKLAACAQSLSELQLIPLQKRHVFHTLAVLYAQAGRGQDPHGNYKPKLTPPCPREDPAWRPPTTEIIGEALFHLRPVIYVLAFLWFNGGRGHGVASKDPSTHSKDQASRPGGSMIPWVLSFLVDAIARVLLPRSKGLPPSLQQEMTMRTLYYVFYLVRSPVFERFTRQQILQLQNVLRMTPLVGSLLGGLIDVLLSLQSHYFYISAS
eukprot:gb/GEZN01007876.1/.p1 GENE.gb/GEZN01007876.1/~~gb/GEZN01007876.1/.p1  ORF type:complete len:384 (+),score=41.87 gb/GEZN01007876.1/:48-1199(+)